ncbi:uncharacterized protein LOC132314311 [Cornus florida]|uniref:uncharacterized protein LOC132314311 n=1 Tax=Cornus florida TaxID=4283 RepID=UPI002899EEB9|nr:uncharacterized protein LOC132314311 [Cornus florida]
MLFSTSSSSSSSSPAISDEDFNLFHSIDRELYSILIFYLCRDPAESMQVMALWLWLERAGYESRLVKKLLSTPVPFINAVADETVTCLKCIETDNFPTDPEGNDIPTLKALLRKSVAIQYFHENRLTILRGVTKIMNEVCARAFDDILRRIFRIKSLFNTHMVGESSSSSGNNEKNVVPNVTIVPMGYYQSLLMAPLHLDLENEGAVLDHKQFWPSYDPNHMVHAYDPYDLAMQRQFLNSELGDRLSRLSLSVPVEEKEVPQDDRTIFLTFSKGYPISETEVRDFFTGKFGDFIEVIHMQEVQQDEQVLYARVVCRYVPIIDVVLHGQMKAKFTINGKHVWARKYVRKNPRSPPTVSSPPQPASTVGLPQP